MLWRGLLFLFSLRGLIRLLGRLLLDRRVSLLAKLIPPAALIYLVSPLDIVPDIVPVLGHIDDVVIILVSTVSFLALTPREVLMEHLGRVRPDSQSAKHPPKHNGTVVEGKFRIIADDEDIRS